MWNLLQTTSEPIIQIRFRELSQGTAFGLAVLICVLVITLTALFSYTLLRSQTYPRTQALVSSLALLTFIALAAAIIVRSPAMETIAATGIGAIAGAVSYQFTARRDNMQETPDTPDEEGQETEEAPRERPPLVPHGTRPETETDPTAAGPEGPVPAEETVENPMVEDN